MVRKLLQQKSTIYTNDKQSAQEVTENSLKICKNLKSFVGRNIIEANSLIPLYGLKVEYVAKQLLKVK